MSTEVGNDDERLLAADVEAREDALDTRRSFIVQAPAGSGKTELLIQRYLRLLGEVENPEEVLAITFTRKAAAEMRLRVMQALQQAAAGDRPDQTHQEITFDAAAEVLRCDDRFGWALIENPARMRIQTLDSLNASLARMQPMTGSGAGSSASVVEGSAMNEIYSLAAAATLDWLAEQGVGAAATAKILDHVDNNTNVYIGYLNTMLRTRDQWLPFIRSGELDEAQANALRETFEANLARIVTDQLVQVRQELPMEAAAEFMALAVYAAENLRAAGKEDHPICAIGREPLLPEANCADLMRWQGLAELLLTKDGAVRKRIDKNTGFPPGDDGQKAQMSVLLDSLRDDPEFPMALHATRCLPPATYTDEQWSVLVALFRLLPVAVSELKRICHARGVTDHIQIALGAEDVLGTPDEPGEVALLLDYQVRHILVDEMQDTSKAQYRMLESLTGGWEAGDGRTLFCVGDPMQSIYRFRNAEVAQFLLARENGIGSIQLEPLVLRRNFRSGEYLVDWFNHVFPKVLPVQDDAANGAVAYSDAVSVDDHAGQGELVVHPLFGGSDEAEAAQGRNIIGGLVKAHPGESIAVLVRSRTRLPALLHELREAGISYQAIDIDRLTDLPEVIDVLALTRAFVHPGDRVAWLGLLRSPWIGLDWTDLHAIVRNDRDSTVLELLHDKKRIDAMSEGGREAAGVFLERLEPFLRADRCTPLHQRVEKAWYALGGPALMMSETAVENVYRYLQVLRKLEIAGSISDTVRFMQQLADEWVSTNVAAQVQVMTMHKAKGLEFDHVLLYGLGRYNTSSNTRVLSWLDLPNVHGREEKVISSVGRRDEVDRDPIHRYIEQTRAAKERNERSRLLYVACTRAQKSLHLAGHVRVDDTAEEFREPHKASLLRLLWPIVQDEYADAFESVPRVPEIDEEQRIEPQLRRLDGDWALPDTATTPWRDSPVDSATADRKVEYYWVGADARLAGTVVHRWLQLAAQGKIDFEGADLELLRPASRRWLQEAGAGSAILEPVCDRVLHALEQVRTDARGRWLLAGDGKAEFALNGIYADKLESIVIDRIRIDEDGTHWIVDYKTSSHEGGDLPGFLENEALRYREQLEKYKTIYAAWSGETPRCALYFPLLKEFVEVDV